MRLGLRFLIVSSILLCVWIGFVVPRLVAAPPALPPLAPENPGDYENAWQPYNPIRDAAVARLEQENRRLRAQVRGYRRTLLHSTQVSEAIDLACITYHVSCSTLWRKARCESQLYRYAANRHSSARGLFQFLTTPNGGTWGSTPYGRFSVFSPYANALAAAWMHANGRGGEWVCQ